MVDTKISAETLQATISGAHMLGVDSTPLNKKFPGYAFWGEKGASVASAGTLVLGDDGNFFHITGTTTITDIDFTTAKDGRMAVLEFDGALTLTHNGTTLTLPGGVNITTAGGDRAIVVQDNADNVHVIDYIRYGASSYKSVDVILEDQKTSGTGGGTFTSGADRTRDLNTKVYDPNGYCSLASNQFTLGAGTWEIEWMAPAYVVQGHQSFLYNVTDATVVKRSGSAYNNVDAVFLTTGKTVVAITGSKAFEIRHRCTLTSATNGFGVAASFGTETYTRVLISKVA